MSDRRGRVARPGEGVPSPGRLSWRWREEGWTIFLLYFLLAAGGLWHVLGWFQELMQLLAAPMLIALALLLAALHARRQGTLRRVHGRALLFYTGVVLSAFALEWLGVTTGRIFGPYRYGEVLQPQLAGVPLAIGFAWLAMVLSSAGLTEWIMAKCRFRSPLWQVLLIALLMLLFDWIMEPAAVRLGYWQWREGLIPVQNYLAWFVFALLYAAAAWRLDLLQRGAPAVSRHAWVAQIIYFLLVRLG